MNIPEFTPQEIDKLCDLYFEGELSVKEEKNLRLLLETTEDLSETGISTLKVMRCESRISREKKNVKTNRFTWISGIAATLLLGCLTFGYLLNSQSRTDSEETYVVWRDGKKITGEEAKMIVDEQERIDMQTLRKIMRLQRQQTMGTMAHVEYNQLDR